jgi:hypothetical protein
VPVIEDHGLHDDVDSPIVIRADRTDSDGDPVLLADLRCDLRTGEISWTVYRQPGTQYASGVQATYADVRALLSDSESAQRLDGLRDSYRRLFDAVGQKAPSL